MRKSVKIIMLFSVLLMVVGCGKQTTEKVLESAEAEQEEKYKQIAEEMGTLQWPTTGLATMLPVPESKKGKIDWMKSYGMFLYVGDTTEEQFNAYVDACYNQGFNMEMNRGEDYYMADNELGYSLDLRLWSYELMSIRVDQVQNTNDEASEPEETAPTEEAAPEESDDAVSMLADYAKYMGEYTSMMSKIDALQKEDMTAEELAYYTEVTTRVSQKLLEVAQ